MKTSMSRFQIHDDLTAPDGSVPVLRGALATGGQLPNFLGVLAGSPAALRAYARFRSELRHGKLTLATLERIALAVAEHYHSEPGIAMHSRTARAAGLALDEVAPARQFTSKDQREAALLRYLQSMLEGGGRPAMHLHEEAREAGWDDEQILEAIAARRAREVHRDGQRRRRGAGRRLQRGVAGAAGSVSFRFAMGAQSKHGRADAEGRRVGCCPLYHEAVELVGRRWTGAILRVLMDGPLRFSEIAQAVPELSDRLLSERMKELEARGIVERTVIPGPPLRVEYSLSQMGRELEPALSSSSAGPTAGSAGIARPSAPDQRTVRA